MILTLRLQEGLVEVPAEQWVGQVAQELLQQGCHVVRTRRRVQGRLLPALPLLAELQKVKVQQTKGFKYCLVTVGK